MTPEQILSHIRNIPNFPKQGIMFKDITTALQKPEVFRAIIDSMCEQIKDLKIDYIAAIESRGYLFAAPLAYKLGVGLVLIRKSGKLPAKVVREEYSLEYGIDALEMHQDALERGKNVLLVDDLLTTGGTIKAASRLVEQIGANVIGSLFLLELKELSQKTALPMPVYSLIQC
ncbi:MAG: adenine phosphoribosyltransferase [Acetobacter sp.]|nr:adenine phosphoribosyltransferase [Acetobacter sp.]